MFREPGAEIIAEDLGVVPDFVRESLARLPVPGYKVFRWERRWHDEGQPFSDPVDYPAVAVATSGTHDTEPMVIWWENAPREERQARARHSVGARTALATTIAHVRSTRPDLPHAVHEALLEALFASGADLLILPIQDVFGWRDRINQPATVGDDELDVAAALAGGPPVDRTAGAGRGQSAPGVVSPARAIDRAGSGIGIRTTRHGWSLQHPSRT